ncbi:MAG: FeoB-associated Cys-rich membrane protein [Evtepia sp.]
MNLASVLILLAVIAAAGMALRVFLKSGGRGKGCGCGCDGCQAQCPSTKKKEPPEE